MKLITLLYDMMDIVGCVPTMNKIGFTSTPTGVEFTCTSTATKQSGTFVLYGKTSKPLDQSIPEFGIYDFYNLIKVLKNPGFDRLNSLAEILLPTDGQRNSVVKISTGDEQSCALTVTTKPEELRKFSAPKLKKKINYSIHFAPTLEGLATMKYWYKQDTDKCWDFIGVTPSIRNGKLYLKASEYNWCIYDYLFAKNIGGSLSVKNEYDCRVIFALSSLVQSTKKTIVSFSDQGLCRMKILTGCAEYEFLLPTVTVHERR